jgi:ubiquinone/menaquinone biosynthesis C-methylase UbiE
VILRAFLAVFFRELYTRLAWTYDAVAMTVSVGEWFHWQRAAIDALLGDPVLEIGFGTGHLQAELATRNRFAVGIDRSRQMARISRHRLRRLGLPPRLVRADAEALPFASQAFVCAVSTFPSDYMFEQRSLQEVRRVLRPQGRLVVIPMAQITGRGLLDRLAAWLFQITGQSGPILEAWTDSFRQAGYDARVDAIELPRARVARILADLPGPQTGRQGESQRRPG